MITNETRRSIFLVAWESKRSEPARTFSDCLRGAWAFSRRMAKAAYGFIAGARRHGGRVQFSPALYRSPIARTLSGRSGGAHRDFQAAIVTARVGY